MTDFPLIEHELRPLNAAQLRQLLRDLNPSRVATRKQGGSNLSYLEGWDVRASLVKIFGFGGFSSETIAASIVKVETDIPRSGGGTTNFRVTALCTTRLHIHQLGAVYTEAGAASQSGADIGEVTDFAIKTAETDAMKRCAVNLGTQFGMSLYDGGSTMDVIGSVLADGQRKLDIEEAVVLHAWDSQTRFGEMETLKKRMAEQASTAGPSPAVDDPDDPDTPMALAAEEASAKASDDAVAAAFKQEKK